jgi:chaperonin cofactor prefoldin
MFAIAVKMQGTAATTNALAGTTNANQAALQQLHSSLQAGDKRHAQLQKQMENIKEFLEHAVSTIEKSYRTLETNCVATINTMAEHHKEVKTAHGVCITSLQEDRDRLDQSIMNTHHLAYTGEYKQRDGTIIESDISVKVKALEEKVATLQDQNKTLLARVQEEQTPGSTHTGDASLFDTVEARLEAKIEAQMEASYERVADTLNARFNEALKLFEGHITRRREEEQATRAQTNPLVKDTPSKPKVAAPQPTQSHNNIDLRIEENDVNSASDVANVTNQPSSSRQKPAQTVIQPQTVKGKEIRRPTIQSG